MCVGGAIGVVVLSVVLFILGFDLATAGFSLLTLIALLSLFARFYDSIFLSIVAVGCLTFLFAPPVFDFKIDDPDDVAAVVAFLTTTVIITGLAAKVRKTAEEELRQTRSDLARFARVATLGELTASIAHEVNQPLAGVVSSGDACLRWLAGASPNIEKARQSVSRIIRDANRASEVIQRVRGLVKNTPPQKIWMNINEAILEVTLLSRGGIEQNRISLSTHLANDVPMVWADRIQLQQVFLNLIVNAIEALRVVGAGPRELSVGTEKDESNGVLATVRDSGVGLDSGKLHEMFDAFYTTKDDGMGMGLAICRSIIEAHGGRLWATPNEPRGAIFRLTLPIGREGAS
jgi:C4-dicarboxylate-specific signal transduction histidine kinase